jgi:hypothetical protein
VLKNGLNDIMRIATIPARGAATLIGALALGISIRKRPPCCPACRRSRSQA